MHSGWRAGRRRATGRVLAGCPLILALVSILLGQSCLWAADSPSAQVPSSGQAAVGSRLAGIEEPPGNTGGIGYSAYRSAHPERLGTDGYWLTYQGKPFYLIGNGMESIYTNPPVFTTAESIERWMNYLDMLAGYKVNLIRFYAWAFVWYDKKIWQGSGPWPYTNLDQLGYDLDSSSDPYWDTVTAIAEAAAERGSIFQYVLFEGWMNKQLWDKNPWNLQRGGPLSDWVSFYDLVNVRNRYLQEKYVQQALDKLGHLPNVIFEIANELAPNPYSQAWAAHWVSYAKERIPDLPLTISEPSWHFGPDMATERYWEWPGIDIVSPHETDGERALYGGYVAGRFGEYWQRDLKKPLIVGEWCGPGDSLDYADERKLFWTAFASGGHGARSCWPLFHESPSLPWLRNMSDFLDGTTLGKPVGFSEMRPSPWVARLSGTPDGYQALALANAGKEYVIYIRAPKGYREMVEGGQLEVNLPPGEYEALWYDPKSGTVQATETLRSSGGRVSSPVFQHSEDVVLYLVVDSSPLPHQGAPW